MSAHYPCQPDGHRTDADIERDILPPVTINEDGITIGDTQLPGQWIERSGVLIEPGSDDSINTISITFIVGDIDVSDEALRHVRVGSGGSAAMAEWQKAMAAFRSRQLNG